jgi:uncharacterized membrane protein
MRWGWGEPGLRRAPLRQWARTLLKAFLVIVLAALLIALVSGVMVVLWSVVVSFLR